MSNKYPNLTPERNSILRVKPIIDQTVRLPVGSTGDTVSMTNNNKAVRKKEAGKNEVVMTARIRSAAMMREFTFTGYDIMKDRAPSETPVTMETPRGRIRLYEESCRRYGAIPCRSVLQGLNAAKIEVKRRPLGPSGAKALATVLFKNESVEKVEIPGNALADLGASALSSVLLQNNIITELDLSENGIGYDGLFSICSALKENKTVKKLNLAGNKISDREAVLIGELLENNIYLLDMNISNNDIREDGGEVIGHCLGANDTIERLDIGWNHLRGKGALAIAAGLKENVGIRVLGLAWNGFSLSGTLNLASSLLKNRTLEELDLTNNRIPVPGIVALMDAIVKTTTLHTLKLGQNGISAPIASSILKLLSKPQNRSCTLKELDLGNCYVDKDFEPLLTILQSNRVIRVFYSSEQDRISNVGSLVKTGPLSVQDTLAILFAHIKKEGIQIEDMFQDVKISENSSSVRKAEFKESLLSSKLKLSEWQVVKLIEKLEHKGSIDLRELANMEEEFICLEELITKKH